MNNVFGNVCYGILFYAMVWSAWYAMGFVCYAMRFVCYEICMLWDLYAMRYVCYAMVYVVKDKHSASVPLSTHALKGVSETEYFLMTSFSVC